MNWNDQITTLPNAHILQTIQWGKVKQKYGWKVLPQTWNSEDGRLVAAAQVLQRTIPVVGLAARMSILYIPRGPLLDWSDLQLVEIVLDALETLARRKGAIFIKIDPEIIIDKNIHGTTGQNADDIGQKITILLKNRGWVLSNEQIQFQNTMWLNLEQTQDALLGKMKQKTRYNIRLAERKGVSIRSGTLADLHQLYKMYAETSLRDGFVIRTEGYYRTVWSTFMDNHMAEPIIAEVEGELVAGLFLFYFASKAWYLYGMSRDIHRDRMPNYLLQWHAICRAKSLGCKTYDMWGAPNQFVETDPMWGVYRFKEGFGGKLVCTPGAWDFTQRTWLYNLYTRILPNLLSIMRRRGKAHTRQQLSL